MEAPTRTIRTAAAPMTAGPRTCSLFSSVLEAVMIFRGVDCAAVPVVDDGVPGGVLTDRDVALASADDTVLLGRPVTDIMRKGAISVTPDTPLEDVRERSSEDGTHYLLVVDVAGQLQGIITSSDLVPYLAGGPCPRHERGRPATLERGHCDEDMASTPVPGVGDDLCSTPASPFEDRRALR